MKRKIEAKRGTVKNPISVALLAALREAYRAEVRAVAERLALQFQARRFDDTVDEEEPRFMLLEELCEQLPICRNNATAGVVVAASKYAAKAQRHSSNLTSWPGELLRNVAAWCLARDVHDEAIMRGWACSRAERQDTGDAEDPEEKRRRRDADAKRKAARS